MRHRAFVGILFPTVLVLTAGCATKGWVRDLVGTKSNEVNERVNTVDTRVGTVETRVVSVEGRVGEEAQRVDSRFKSTEAAIGEVNTTATGARQRADEVDSRVTRLWSNRHARRVVETANLHFGFDRADLSDQAQTALSGLVKELRENTALTVDLEGYTDPKGAPDYNVRLAQRRVEAVRRYLVANGVELPRIFSVGLGPLAERGLSDAQKRRVTVRLMVYAE
jgi:outer membrane protein OmpA-like peptidoglycan-associated protein